MHDTLSTLLLMSNLADDAKAVLPFCVRNLLAAELGIHWFKAQNVRNAAC